MFQSDYFNDCRSKYKCFDGERSVAVHSIVVVHSKIVKRMAIWQSEVENKAISLDEHCVAKYIGFSQHSRIPNIFDRGW
jgi:hypothetical protein